MTENLTQLLLRLSEEEPPALLWGRSAQPHFGPGFDRLLDSRILIEERPAEQWPICSSCECDLDMRPLTTIADTLVAACPLDHSKDEKLEEDDLRIFRLDQRALVQEIARVSAFKEAPSEIFPGFWSLGMSQSGIEVSLTFYESVARRPETVDALLRVARGRRRMLIVPALASFDRAPFDHANIHVVAISECLRIDPSRAVPALNVEGVHAATSEPSLIIQCASNIVFLDNAECRLPPRLFKLIHYLAAQAAEGKALCDLRGIEKHLWATTVSEKAVADAIRDLRKKIKPILNKDMAPDRFIQSRPPTGYMLTVPPEEIRIDP